jgi:hypothetical protein
MSAALQVDFPFISIKPVGSRETCSPPPDGTDRDWLALIPINQWLQMDQYLSTNGWEYGGSISANNLVVALPDEHFASYTKNIEGTLENLIVTDSPVFQRRFMAATGVAKRLNLLEKKDRIDLFQAVLYGNDTGA